MNMKAIVGELCSERCAGRAAGTAEGRAARAVVIDALRAAGLDPFEQLVPGCGGANVLATLPARFDRWVLVAAHYDHLGRGGGGVYWGANDNAAAVAILVDAARALARVRQDGRSVLFAAFDGEEPPHFLTGGMGSMHFTRHPTVPLESIDMMVCMGCVA
jgi:Zn-dependent M28 family amino/carboxypeptidase